MNRYDALSRRLQKIGVSAAPRNSSFYKQNPSVVLAPKMGVLYIFITQIFFFFFRIFSFHLRQLLGRHVHCPNFCGTTEFCRALREERAMRQELYKKGSAQTEFRALNPPMRTSFTTSTISLLQNDTNLKKKRKEEKQIAQASCWNSKIQRKKENVPTPSSAQTDPRCINDVEYHCR